jgi:glyoxylase I family protein
MKVDTDVLSIHRGLLLFAEGLGCGSPECLNTRVPTGSGGPAPSSHQIGAARRSWETCEVPSITGRVEVCLTVRDPVLSAAWYAALLGMQTQYDHTSGDGQMRYVCLVEPSSSLVLCLVGHARSTGEPFTEFRTGLDHLEFVVASRDDLEQWAERLDELGVPHSGVKNLDYTANAMLTFRDPDNIQLEFFWRATAPEGA